MKRSNSNSLKKLMSLSLAAITLTAALNLPILSTTAAAEDNNNDDTSLKDEYLLADSIQEGTILHCFDWTFEDITKALPLIARSGFTSIQVSPVQGNGEYGTPWYYVYNPYGFKIFDSYGYTAEELKTLCDEADKYGINIIMDVIANHLDKNMVSVFDNRLVNDEYWHEHHNIQDYTNREQITNGSLDGLYDLNTENELIQQMVYNYTQELKDLGVDGIRWDAAKHIALPSEGSDFWKIAANNGLYNYGEILTGPTDDKNNDHLMAEYTEYMSVTDSTYSNTLTESFYRGTAPEITGNWTDRGVAKDKLVYWGESHDTYSNNWTTGGTTNIDQNIIDRAYSVAAAREGATSLYFSRPFAFDKDEIYIGEKGSEHFSSPEISAVNHFHNAMAGKKDCYAVSNNCSVVTRENGGAVIVCGSSSGEVCVENAGGFVKPGTYKDEISGNTFTVTDETISGTVSECGIAVVYDSEFSGRVYTDYNKEEWFFESIDVALHCRDTVSASYTLVKHYISGETETEETETAEYKDGDVITLRGIGYDPAYFVLTLTGINEKGRTLSETYTFYHTIYGRTEPDTLHTPGYITFDNIKKQWEKVYIYAYDDQSGEPITNGEFPGQLMTEFGTGYYTYQIPEQFEGNYNIHIVFSNEKGERIDKNPAKNNVCDLIVSYNSFSLYSSSDSWLSNYLGLLGDYYTDGKINARDALEVLRITLLLGDYMGSWLVADVNKDGDLNAKDSLLIQRYSLKLSKNEYIGTPVLLDFFY